jgi:serine/threonine protein kinase
VLLDRIGAGGMAEIFRAKTFGAAGFEKEFAVKLILPSLVDDDEFVEMFINEAKIAVKLYHANIVQVFDLGEIEAQYYIAMEYVHGKDLLDVLARCAEMDIHIPLHIVLFVTMEMLKGLDFAHRARDPYGEDLNIIHRDISPSNILISYAGDVKVGDFGVAKAAHQRQLTESGTLKGKVGYMSPEQVMGDVIDARSDIFSAGIVFFEAISMSRLFAGGADLDVMMRVRDANIGSRLEAAGPLPSGLQDIIRRALSRHREERYQTAGEFYQGLVDFCFQHDIRTTDTDLSNFMRRLFAKEIEEEKAQRRNDPHAPALQMVSDSLSSSVDDSLDVPDYADPREVLAAASAPEAAPSAPPKGAGVLRRTNRDRDVPEAEPAQGEPRYRYRDGNGLIYGPMTMRTMLGLLESRPPQDEDKVSVDDGDWQAVEQVESLREKLDELYGDPRSSAEMKKVWRAAGTGISVRRDESPEEVPLNQGHMLTDASDSSDPLVETSSEVERERSKVVEQLRQNYTMYEGMLSDISFPRMVARLLRDRGTGRLNLLRGDVDKSVYFQDGEVILVDSNREEELLGAFLLSREIISKEQLDEGFDRLTEWGGRLGDALVAIGAIAAHEIFQLLSDQMREKLLEIFEWEDGRYGFYEGQEPSMHGYPLGVDCYGMLAEGCRERVSFERLLAFYKERQHVALYMRDPAPFHMDKLRLRANELRVANMMEQGQSLNGLLRKFPPSQRDTIYRTVYLLHQCELVTFEMTTERVNFPGEL